jgi:hypothetical protein
LAKESTLTTEERVLCDTILIGCTLLIAKLGYSPPSQIAKTIIKNYGKSKVSSHVYYKLPELLKSRKVITRSDIVNNLDESIKDIHPSELGDVVHGLIRMRSLERNTGWKRPGQKGIHGTDLSPAEHEYKSTKLNDEIEVLLNKREALNLIYYLLDTADLIYEYWKQIRLVSFHIMSLNRHSKKRAMNICKLLTPEEVSNHYFEQLYEWVIKTKERKQLEILAANEAVRCRKEHTTKYYVNIFRAGFKVYTSLFHKLSTS